jgi:hypothetical protein
MLVQRAICKIRDLYNAAKLNEELASDREPEQQRLLVLAEAHQ